MRTGSTVWSKSKPYCSTFRWTSPNRVNAIDASKFGSRAPMSANAKPKLRWVITKRKNRFNINWVCSIKPRYKSLVRWSSSNFLIKSSRVKLRKMMTRSMIWIHHCTGSLDSNQVHPLCLNLLIRSCDVSLFSRLNHH